MKDLSILILLLGLIPILGACDASVGVDQSATAVPSSLKAFASGVKAVRVNLSNDSLTGSFQSPGTGPVPVTIPDGYPGAGSGAQYLPGVAAYRYFDPSGLSVTQKPSWIQNIEIGVPTTATSHICAGFGTGGTLDPMGFYRTSEADCLGASPPILNGTGGTQDSAFIRIILNRDNAYLGTQENLLLQVEYQATGANFNSLDTTAGTDPEAGLDQLWKIFLSDNLKYTSPRSPFSVFVPPNYACTSASCSGTSGASVDRGSPITVKQILVPLSSLSSRNVIQFSRVKGRINSLDSTPWISDAPLSVGVVFRSLTLIRM